MINLNSFYALRSINMIFTKIDYMITGMQTYPFDLVSTPKYIRGKLWLIKNKIKLICGDN
jgi:hypothetical protein